MPTGPATYRRPGRQADCRPTAAARGYDHRWQKRRKAYLREHPLCVVCLTAKRVVPSTTVDHIVPHRGDETLFWHEGNWQALCKRHHDAKTAREDGGFGRARGAKILAPP